MKSLAAWYRKNGDAYDDVTSPDDTKPVDEEPYTGEGPDEMPPEDTTDNETAEPVPDDESKEAKPADLGEGEVVFAWAGLSRTRRTASWGTSPSSRSSSSEARPSAGPSRPELSPDATIAISMEGNTPASAIAPRSD